MLEKGSFCQRKSYVINMNNNRSNGAGQPQPPRAPQNIPLRQPQPPRGANIPPIQPQPPRGAQSSPKGQPQPPRGAQNIPPRQPQTPMGAQNIPGRQKQQPPRGVQANPRQAGGAVNHQAPAKVQTPPPKKVKLSQEQIQLNKLNREKERARAKKRRAATLRMIAARAVLFVVILALVSGITAALFFINLNYVKPSDSSRYKYDIGGKTYSLPYSKAVRDGRVYVSFTDVAELCDLAVIGSAEDMKYVVKGDEAETIRFITDSRVVYVNDVETRLGAECYYEKGEVYVPVDFVGAYLKGLDIRVDEKKHEVEISKVITNLNEKGKVPKGEEAEYAPLSFLLQSTAGLKPLDEEQEAMATMPDLGFQTNLMIYEEYMNPGNTDEFLTLVNVDNKLDSTYAPQDLYVVEATRDDGRKKQMLRLNAAMALEALFKEMKAAGYEDVSVTSAYRSYSYQEQLFNQYLAQHNNDYEYVATFSNPPGSSEHQTGLCVDMHNLPAADVSFANEEVFGWLKENCWKFGFILRYPENKVDVTGISYEPWHYRYVGRYHAQRMYQMNMCLEEYLDYINVNH